jgi:hypothetical protein
MMTNRAAVAIDSIMPKVSVCRSPSRLTTRVAGGFAGLDRARQTEWGLASDRRLGLPFAA